MAKIYDVSDFGLCMISNVRMFRRTKDFDFFKNLEQMFYRYSKNMSNNTLFCSLRDLQPHSLEGVGLNDEEYASILPLYDFSLTVLISRKLRSETDKPFEWIMSDIMIQSECIGGRFENQSAFDAWVRNRDFKCNCSYQDIDPFDMEETDIGCFNMLLLHMLEYSAPRYTYMPMATRQLIEANIHLLTQKTKNAMIQIIDETIERFDKLGCKAGAWDGYDPCLVTLRNILRGENK